ncbi:endonuclease domain-containing 1 protein-like [Brienomyrus brachyistius]|uniref:endonuclease domain-containing 1 protein-like n=1 Tax=Brienomyrus brachyistius TaxID=42636 RepID=UPI0020B25AEF|nr:endonuclease domain-containing 1 protein-like [Brienomyrus brachyistius]
MQNFRLSHSCMIGLLVGLATLAHRVRAEVGSFSSCLQFFHKASSPRGLGGPGYSEICQRYENTYHFASLYCKQRRTPIYSAYVFSSGGRKRYRVAWMYEPQLANSRARPEMEPIPPNMTDQNVLESQAVLQDYMNSTFTKGHLSPNSHHKEDQDKNASFTLTNIVPQKAGSNSGPWAVLENEVAARLIAYCTGPAYIVTGVLPYVRPRWIRNRVAVPEYLWSAYCCPSFKSSLPESLHDTFPTFAAIGRNDRLSPQDIVPVNPKARNSTRGYDVRRMPLETLEGYLRERLGGPVNVFLDQCL